MLPEQWTLIGKVLGWEKFPTIVRILHGISEGKPIRNSPFRVLFSREDSRFRK
jgi:hypothetical protein